MRFAAPPVALGIMEHQPRFLFVAETLQLWAQAIEQHQVDVFKAGLCYECRRPTYVRLACHHHEKTITKNTPLRRCS
jgi:hypothetical protein